MKVYLEAYGCTLNFTETSMVAEAYRRSGYEIVEDPEIADIIVVGSCIVIEHTERKILRRIKKFESTNKRVYVIGCMPSGRKDLLSNLNVIPIPSTELEKRYEELGLEVNPYDCVPKLDRVDIGVPISQGCLGNCSYCITKLARGNLRSRSIDYILNYVRQAIKLGYREIRLTAQDTGDYGKDIGTDISTLIKSVAAIDGDFRIRVGMMSPQKESIFSRILDAFENEKVYKFFHLPVQSGDDEVLQDMNRRYSVEDFVKNVEMIRERFEHFTLSTDIIVGYPTETEESFRKTVELIEYTSPDIINITRFSARPGTKAYSYKELPGRIVKKRSRTLTKLSIEIGLRNNLKLFGKSFEILIVENGKENGNLVGRTNFYRPVVIKNERFKIGEFSRALIVGVTPHYLIGK